MFIDKNELDLENIEDFKDVKGLNCNIAISIEAVDNNNKVLTGKNTSILPDHIIDKIKNKVIDCYKDEFENQLLNGQFHIMFD